MLEVMASGGLLHAIGPKLGAAYRSLIHPRTSHSVVAPTAGSFHPLAERKERIMFTRVVELWLANKARELSSTINNAENHLRGRRFGQGS